MLAVVEEEAVMKLLLAGVEPAVMAAVVLVLFPVETVYPQAMAAHRACMA